MRQGAAVLYLAVSGASGDTELAIRRIALSPKSCLNSPPYQ